MYKNGKKWDHFDSTDIMWFSEYRQDLLPELITQPSVDVKKGLVDERLISNTIKLVKILCAFITISEPWLRLRSTKNFKFRTQYRKNNARTFVVGDHHHIIIDYFKQQITAVQYFPYHWPANYFLRSGETKLCFFLI